MLSKEDTRRLAQLERQLITAVVLGAVGWWIATSIVATWAVITLSAAVYRLRRQRAETAYRNV
jgi:hypothetical protein